MGILLTISNNPEDVVREEHVCYYTNNFGCHSDEINLYEVVEICYKHPQAPEDALVPVIETRVLLRKLNRKSLAGSRAVLLEAAQKAAYQGGNE